MGSVFLSYSGIDRDIASALAQGLKAADVDVWRDREAIGWGDNWIGKLEEALSHCDGYVILVGSSGVGRWVKAELYLAIKRHFEQELPILPVLLPGLTPAVLPPFLAMFQAETLPNDLNNIDFTSLAQRVRSAANTERAKRVAEIPSDVCPFPGLEAFGEEDASFFFGRQKETLDAVRRLGLGLDGVYRRWLVVEGPSGVGKSSLVRAGIIPAIKLDWANSSEGQIWRRWHVVDPMRPGTDPIENLAEVLSKTLSREADKLPVHALYSIFQGEGYDPKALRHLLRERLPGNEALVLTVDQLEEIFTLTVDEKLRSRFDILLAEALTDLDGPLHLITTIRSDFMLHFNVLPHLQGLLNENAARYFLEPMNEIGLRDVVQSPARIAGLCWSDDALPGDIVDEARNEPSALPLIENLLRLLWHRRERNVLGRDVYRELGGVGGALARSADALLESLGAAKENALEMLVALVKVGRETQDTRRTITKAMAIEAAGGGPEAERILDRLSGLRTAHLPRAAAATPRLVVVSTRGSGEETTHLVDLAHETLLRYDRNDRPYWATLTHRIRSERKRLEDRDLLEILAKGWEENDRARDRLATRAQLKNLRSIRGLSACASAFVDASLSAVKIRSRLLTAYASGVFLFVGVLLFVFWTTNVRGLTPRLGTGLLLAGAGIYYLQPEMVRIPPGSFKMESSDADKSVANSEVEVQFSQREVTISKSFEIGKYEVTFDEYDLFAHETRRPLPDHKGWGRGKQPVIDVSLEDARNYADWLSTRTGKRYRLPTEAEWEYAARGGTTTLFWWGDHMEFDRANCSDCESRPRKKPAPVGSFRPNPFGVYDTAGNVWEWVQGSWLRGGSWAQPGEAVRSGHRVHMDPTFKNNGTGFRLARDVE